MNDAGRPSAALGCVNGRSYSEIDLIWRRKSREYHYPPYSQMASGSDRPLSRGTSKHRNCSVLAQTHQHPAAARSGGHILSHTSVDGLSFSVLLRYARPLFWLTFFLALPVSLASSVSFLHTDETKNRDYQEANSFSVVTDNMSHPAFDVERALTRVKNAHSTDTALESRSLW